MLAARQPVCPAVGGRCMSTKEARDLARKARKIAPKELYELARNVERAIEELAKEIEKLRSELEAPRRSAFR